MTIFLSHSTAALYWLQAAETLPARGAVPTPQPTAHVVKECFDTLGESYLGAPFYELSVAGGNRAGSDGIALHLYPQHANGLFLAKSSILYIACPELTFLQAASYLDFSTLIEFGSYLCGSFFMDDFSPTGFSPRKPLTTCKKLASFLAKNHQVKYAAKARRALSYVLDDNASPAEIAASLLVSLPNMYGGYGFRDAHVNYQVDITAKNAKVASKSFYRIDIAWPQKKIALEYDSDMFHANPQGIAADSKKRNALLMARWHVIALTREQLYSQAEMDKVALVIRKLYGKRHLDRTDKYERAKSALRKQLLFSGPLKERILQQAEAHF